MGVRHAKLTKSLACCFSVKASSFSSDCSSLNVAVLGASMSLGSAPGVFMALLSGLLSPGVRGVIGG